MRSIVEDQSPVIAATGYSVTSNNRTTAMPGLTYTYDDAGNRTSKTETATGKVEEYTWDYRNRLTAVRFRNTSTGPIVREVTYEYDALNRLVRRDHDSDGTGAAQPTSQFWAYDDGINVETHHY